MESSPLHKPIMVSTFFGNLPVHIPTPKGSAIPFPWLSLGHTVDGCELHFEPLRNRFLIRFPCKYQQTLWCHLVASAVPFFLNFFFFPATIHSEPFCRISADGRRPNRRAGSRTFELPRRGGVQGGRRLSAEAYRGARGLGPGFGGRRGRSLEFELTGREVEVQKSIKWVDLFQVGAHKAWVFQLVVSLSSIRFMVKYRFFAWPAPQEMSWELLPSLSSFWSGFDFPPLGGKKSLGDEEDESLPQFDSSFGCGSKNRYPKWNPGNWTHGLKPVVPEGG